MSNRRVTSSKRTRDDAFSSSKFNNKRPKYINNQRIYISTVYGSVQMSEVVNFMNDIMRQEGFAESINNEDCIVNFGQCKSMNHYWLGIATEQLVNYVCWLNGIFFRGTQLTVRRHIDATGDKPKFSCWNEYHLHRYGTNDSAVETHVHTYIDDKKFPISGDNLVIFFNKKLSQLGFTQKAIDGFYATGPGSFVMTCKSTQDAECLLYLNQIYLEGTTRRVYLRRPKEWEGPSPKFSNYTELMKFIKEKGSRDQSQEAGKKNEIAPPAAAVPSTTTSPSTSTNSATTNTTTNTTATTDTTNIVMKRERLEAWKQRRQQVAETSSISGQPESPPGAELSVSITQSESSSSSPPPSSPIDFNKEDLVSFQKQVKWLTDELNKLEQQNKKLQGNLQQSETECNALQVNVSNKESKITELQSLVDHFTDKECQRLTDNATKEQGLQDANKALKEKLKARDEDLTELQISVGGRLVSIRDENTRLKADLQKAMDEKKKQADQTNKLQAENVLLQVPTTIIAPRP